MDLGAQEIPSVIDDLAMEDHSADIDILDDLTNLSPSPPSPPTLPSPTTSSKHFRLTAVNIFCTWPQSTATKEEVLKRIMATAGAEWAVVCQEDHRETDGVHLHAVVHFKAKKNFKSTSQMDQWGGKPGHYEATKNLKLSVIYITKDGDWIAEGIDVDKFCKEKSSAKSTIIADMIKKEVPIGDIMEKESGFFLLHSNQIRNFAAEWSARKAAKLLMGFKEVIMANNQTPEERSIGIWLNDNLNGSFRPLGKTQLFIYGKTMLGKSRLCKILGKMVKTYFATSTEHFFDRLDESYQLIVFDEFHGQQTVTFMNQLLDGQSMVIPQKGHQYDKIVNTPCIICANYPLKDCYRKVFDENREHFDALNRRLLSVEVTHQLNLWPHLNIRV